MEIDNAIFQDLESFGKGKFFKMAIAMFWILLGKKNGSKLVLCQVPHMLFFLLL